MARSRNEPKSPFVRGLRKYMGVRREHRKGLKLFERRGLILAKKILDSPGKEREIIAEFYKRHPESRKGLSDETAEHLAGQAIFLVKGIRDYREQLAENPWHTEDLQEYAEMELFTPLLRTGQMLVNPSRGKME